MNPTNSKIQWLFISTIVLLTTSCANLNLATMDGTVQQQDLRDFDRDGVIKAREQCADTLIGSTINNVGCGKTQGINQSLTLDIKFANNSAVIPDSDRSEIKRVADFLNSYPDTQVLIEGHTSKVGSASLNKTLSKRRASALAIALVNKYGIAQSRVSTKGYGFERPKNPSDSDEAHAINRRIVAELSGIRQIDDMIWTIYTVDQIE